jgi:intergrase/recombinase
MSYDGKFLTAKSVGMDDVSAHMIAQRDAVWKKIQDDHDAYINSLQQKIADKKQLKQLERLQKQKAKKAQRLLKKQIKDAESLAKKQMKELEKLLKRQSRETDKLLSKHAKQNEAIAQG